VTAALIKAIRQVHSRGCACMYVLGLLTSQASAFALIDNCQKCLTVNDTGCQCFGHACMSLCFWGRHCREA
jgi:hypothetical protein